MDIKLELTDKGLQVHVNMQFDARFPERGRCTTTLVRDVLRQNGILVHDCIKHAFVDFQNQSDTWVFSLAESTLEQIKDSGLECKNLRSRKTASPKKKEVTSPKKKTEGAKEESEAPTLAKKRATKKKTDTEEK